MRPMPTEVKEIIEELEKAVEPNDCGQGIIFAIQLIKAKYGIDDYEDIANVVARAKGADG